MVKKEDNITFQSASLHSRLKARFGLRLNYYVHSKI